MADPLEHQQQLRLDIEELQHLKTIAKRPRVVAIISSDIRVLNDELSEPLIVTPVTAVSPYVMLNHESFNWDQDSEEIKIHVSLECVVQEKIEAVFKPMSFDIKFHDVQGKNYRCTIPKLNKEIVPEKCMAVVDPSEVIITLYKALKVDWMDLHFKEDKWSSRSCEGFELPTSESQIENERGRRVSWTPEVHNIFLGFVLKEVRGGATPGVNLKKQVWARISDEMEPLVNFKFKVKELCNHYDKTRLLWKAWIWLSSQKGVEWYEPKKTYIAPPHVWAKFKELFRDCGKLKDKGFSRSELIIYEEVFGSNHAVGNEIFNLRNPYLPFEQQSNEDQIDEDGMDLEDFHVNRSQSESRRATNGGSQSRMTRNPSPSSSSKRRGKKRQSQSEGDIVSAICGAVDSIVAARTKDPARESNKAEVALSYKLLRAIPGYDSNDPLFNWALSFIKVPENRDVFNILDKEERLKLLQLEYSKESPRNQT